FAQYQSKMYPLDLMEKVIVELSNEFELFLFGGGAHEIEILDKLDQKYNHVTNLSGKLSLVEELDVISNIDGMLSMDSGNAHLAAMFGIPTITIWGVTHPYAGFEPFNQPKENVLLADRNQFPKIPTSIYGNKYPENYINAAKTINPKLVVEKVTFLFFLVVIFTFF
ncbi:MAG: ADP-heptose--LPS heptosyltransferase RfaF, partial [Urechidicola sp.]|nr:ADP-heptose--LPS heptosyltransferase RfaF [Urechidicola sp.]